MKCDEREILNIYIVGLKILHGQTLLVATLTISALHVTGKQWDVGIEAWS
jgi:hypothetical protein